MPKSIDIFKMKLEGVILAAGTGSRMVELTRGRPKCLLPVANQSLIWYAITGLKSIGVSRIIVLVLDIHEADVKQYCAKKFTSCKDIEFVSVPSKADCGTAESILSIKDRIREDFVVYSCDTLIDPKALLSLVNHYRLYDPILSMLLSDNANYFQSRPVPGRREKENYTRDVIALEPLDKLNLTAGEGFSANKVVFIHSERDLEQDLKIRNKELALHPSLEISSRFLDTHVYIFKRQMLDFMTKNSERAVLKAEMIPFLVSRQFSRASGKNSRENLEEEDDFGTYTKQSEYELELREKLECFNPKNLTQSTHLHRIRLPRPSACHALVVGSPIAHRVNTLVTYLDSNRESRAILNAYNCKNINLVKDCVVGNSTTFGNKCTMKRGSIGSNCKIGDKVTIIDCVIMNNVEIESNVSLTECIVGANTKIGPKCDLKSCIIGYQQVIAGGKKIKNESLIDDGYVIDLSDPMIEENE